MHTEPHIKPATLREAEAARYLGVSRSMLRRCRMTGRTRSGVSGPPYVKVPGGRTIVYRIADLDRWLEANLRGGAA